MVRIHQRAPLLTPLPTPLRPVITACLLFGVTLLLYGYRLTTAPLTEPEATILSAASAGSTPVFFHVADDQWLQPLAVYLTAGVRLLGGGDASARLASAIAGALNVALLFVVMRLMVSRTAVALAAAVLLMVTPAHWWQAQLGTDALLPVTFVLLWMLAMLRFLQTDSRLMLALAGLALGAGVYAHPVAPLTMAGLWTISAASTFATRRLTIATAFIYGAGFAAALLPAAVWFASHPETYADTFGRWAILKAHVRYPLDGLRAQINWNTLSNRASIFWGLLDPSFLFFAAPGRAAAPLLLCSLILVPLGAIRSARLAQPAHRVLLFAVALWPPMVAATFGLRQDLAMVAMLPAAAAIVAALGLESLTERHRAVAWTVAALVAASVYQLASLI